MGASVEPLLKDGGQPFKAAVLIPTINNADELDIVLERLSKQTYPHFEIVISDLVLHEAINKTNNIEMYFFIV